MLGNANFINGNIMCSWLHQEKKPTLKLENLRYLGDLENPTDLLCEIRHIFLQNNINHIDLAGLPLLKNPHEQHKTSHIKAIQLFNARPEVFI
jgi:hypothetical protein